MSSHPDLSADEKWSRVSLRIFSDTLSPEQVTEALGLPPTKTHHKGDPVSPRYKMPLRRQHGWILTSPFGGHPDLAAHLRWLLDLIEPKLVALNQLRSTCKIDLFCGFSSGNGQGGFTLDGPLLTRLAKLELNFGLDLYPPNIEELDAAEP